MTTTPRTIQAHWQDFLQEGGEDGNLTPEQLDIVAKVPFYAGALALYEILVEHGIEAVPGIQDELFAFFGESH